MPDWTKGLGVMPDWTKDWTKGLPDWTKGLGVMLEQEMTSEAIPDNQITEKIFCGEHVIFL